MMGVRRALFSPIRVGMLFDYCGRALPLFQSSLLMSGCKGGLVSLAMHLHLSDSVCLLLLVLFNTEEGRKYLVERRGIDAGLVERLSNLGLSSLCNMLAAIKTARYYGLGEDDVILTVATDGAAMYGSEIDKTVARNFGGRFDAVSAGEVWGQSLAATTTDLLLEMTHVERKRVFNLGYFTWVEQQGVSLEEFSARASQSFCFAGSPRRCAARAAISAIRPG